MHSELSKIALWMKANRLSLNVSKTHFMIFRSKNIKLEVTNQLFLDGTIIEMVSKTKFIGVMLDDKLKWDQHIAYIKSKIAKGIGILCKARKILYSETLLTLYHTMIYPYFTYCIEVWGNCAQIHISTLFKLQKKMVRS
jgi:hypothetical protein